MSLSFDAHVELSDAQARFVKGSLVTSFSQVIRFIIQFGSQLVLARLLFPSDFGLLAMIAPVTTIVQTVADIGLGQTIIQRRELGQSEITSLLWVSLGVGLVMCAVTVAVSPLVALAYHEPRVTPVMMVMAVLLPLSTAGVHPSSILLRHFRFGRLAVNEVICQLAGVVASCGFAAWGFGYWSLVIGQFASTTLSLLLGWLHCGWRPSLSRETLRIEWAALVSGGRITGANLATLATVSGDNVIVGLASGSTALGLYDRGYRLVVQPLSQLMAPITRVSTPLLSRLMPEQDRYVEAYLSIVRACFLGTVPLMVSCLFLPTAFVTTLLGQKWGAAAPVFWWICVGGLVSGVYASFSPLLISQGRTKELLHLTVTGAVINMLSFLIGARWGLVGIAAAGATGFVTMSLPMFLLSTTRRGHVRLRHVLDVLAKLSAATLAGAGVLFLLGRTLSFGGPAAVLVFSAVSYATILAATLLFASERAWLMIVLTRGRAALR